MRNRSIGFIILSLVALTLFIFACEDKKADKKAESGEIMGTVTFTGQWPEEGSVSISLNVNWLPVGAPYSFTTITDGDLVGGKYDYHFQDVAFGDYALIVVSWKDLSDLNPSSNQYAIGAHSGSPGEFYLDADVISVTQDNNVLVRDFEADFVLIPADLLADRN
jgi:hypothetical protein